MATFPEKEATARIKINRLLEAAGWRFFPEGSAPADIRLEPSVKIKSTDLDALGDNFEKANEAEENWREIEYPDLDFFVSLEEGKKVFLRKYEVAPGRYRFVRGVRSPLIQELFSMMRGLWIPANHAPTLETALDRIS
jgi:hypothetical protein